MTNEYVQEYTKIQVQQTPIKGESSPRPSRTELWNSLCCGTALESTHNYCHLHIGPFANDGMKVVPNAQLLKTLLGTLKGKRLCGALLFPVHKCLGLERQGSGRKVLGCSSGCFRPPSPGAHFSLGQQCRITGSCESRLGTAERL